MRWFGPQRVLPPPEPAPEAVTDYPLPEKGPNMKLPPLLLSVLLSLSLCTAPALAAERYDGIPVPKSVWKLPRIVPETEIDPSPATERSDELRQALNIQNAQYESFVHGDKDARYQKYIVLHDTEEALDPTGTVGLWLGKNKQQVATHFVIGRDGSVVQCVSLDKIAHHAGWGNTGHNKQFGVPEDGRDTGPSSKAPSGKYKDYGLSGWSVGIELCHVGTQRSGYTVEKDYPEAQLQALDGVIAYIDAYYGFESEIITHKQWRTSNSDTSPAFQPYLEGYRKNRVHGKQGSVLSKTALTGVSGSKGQKLRVSWKRNNTGTGYELEYSTDKGFHSGVKRLRVNKSSTTKATLSKLKKGKVWYVRIRTTALQQASGWSKAKQWKVTA